MKTFICNLGAAAALAACFAAAPVAPAFGKTVVLEAGSASFAAGSSYAWATTSTATIDPISASLANEITGRRLQSAIEKALGGHGFRKHPGPDEADLVVSFHVVVERQADVRVTDNSVRACGWRGCWRAWSSTPDVSTYQYTQGTLVIDLVDRSTGELVWRATSDKRLDADDLTQAKLDSVVAKMMKSLPTV